MTWKNTSASPKGQVVLEGLRPGEVMLKKNKTLLIFPILSAPTWDRGRNINRMKKIGDRVARKASKSAVEMCQVVRKTELTNAKCNVKWK